MKKQESVFDSLYARLNTAQRQAVDSIEGPVLVIAGPGTGKTQVLTLRIANILRKTDIGPDGILALTFTQSGVQAMRQRLASIAGISAYRVHIHTFHGFANEIIRRYPEYFARIIGGQNADVIDQLRIIEKSILSAHLSVLRPLGNPRYYCAPIKSAIDRLKRENISPSDLATHVRECTKMLASEKKTLSAGEHGKRARSLLKLKELTLIYRTYEEALRAEHLYDYGDMVMELIKALETHPDLLLTLREEYQYILADEHQDANQSQNRILELLAGDDADPNLFIVGDERQAIYQFQGASLENFLYFSRRYPTARVIELTDNYRSTQSVLDAVRPLFSHTPLIGRSRGKGSPIRIAALSDEDAEAPFIVSLIAEDIARGTAPEEIALLYRENRDMQRFADALSVAGISFVVESESSVLDDPRVRAFVSLLSGITRQGDERSAMELLLLPWLSIPLLERSLLIEQAQKEKVPLLTLLARSNVGGMREYARALTRWHNFSRTLLLPEAVQRIFDESGATAFMLQQNDSAVLLERMAGLYDALKEYVERHPHARLEDFVEHLALYDVHRISIPAQQSVSRPGVRLMTAHRSKGLEFDSVYLAGAVEGRFGGRRHTESFDLPLRGSAEELSGIDDERRLFYVALTRARDQATVSFARTRSGKAQLPAQFIEELHKERVVFLDTQKFESGRGPEAALMALPKTIPPSIAHRDYVRELFLSRQFSVTHLNNYLECPWRYFFVNLLRIPEAKSPSQSYGTAVHVALKEYGEALSRGKKVKAPFLIERFTHALKKEPLLESLFDDALKKGTAALSGYYKARLSADQAGAQHFAPDAKLEWKLRGPAITVSEGKMLLVGGTLDRLEYEGSTLTVTDFKTRAPLSRNEIQGKTASSNGNYFRQLLFYKLLVDSADLGSALSCGVLDFIEPNERGIYKREVFDLGSDDVKNLVKEIQKVAEEIMSLSFWDRRCGEPDCEYCALRETLESNAPDLARVAQTRGGDERAKERYPEHEKQGRNTSKGKNNSRKNGRH